MASELFNSVIGFFSGPSQPKEMLDRQKRDDQMRAIQLTLQRLRSGVTYFRNQAEIAYSEMVKAKNDGEKQEAITQFTYYNQAMTKKTELEKLIRNISGVQTSMRSAEYSVGAMDVMKNASEYFQSIGEIIDMPMIDNSIDVIQNQELIVAEMSEALTSPFSKHALDNHEDDEMFLSQIDQLIESNEGGTRPKEGPDDLAILDLPTIPADVRVATKSVRKKRKKPKKISAKPIF